MWGCHHLVSQSRDLRVADGLERLLGWWQPHFPCPPWGQSSLVYSLVQFWVLFGDTVSPIQILSFFACVWLPLHVPEVVQGTDP